jgi:C4-dicarboxylate-specific signal transduction histidine kinase
VAHELNQPLSVIRTISSLFQRRVARHEPVSPELLAEIAEGIDAHVERAARIINHMREFGRRADIRLVPVQVNEVLEKAFDLFSQQLALRNIEVAWDLDEKLPPALGQANRLEQVCINLLINARDAIEERWAREAPADGVKRITLRTRVCDEMVCAEVCDTGTGIDPQIVDRLFEPFFTTKEVGKGTGLGLSISYGIIKDFGGTIRARAADGGGACFVISLPRARLTRLDETPGDTPNDAPKEAPKVPGPDGAADGESAQVTGDGAGLGTDGGAAFGADDGPTSGAGTDAPPSGQNGPEA